MPRSIVAFLAAISLFLASTLPAQSTSRGFGFYKKNTVQAVYRGNDFRGSRGNDFRDNRRGNDRSSYSRDRRGHDSFRGGYFNRHLSNAQLRRIILLQHIIIRHILFHHFCKPGGHHGFSKIGFFGKHFHCPVSRN